MTVVQPNSIAGINSISVQSGQSLSIHKSDGTLIREIVASTGISTYSSISVGSATTTNNADKSINIGLGASISQHADNSLSFGTNGDERARINASGNFGIGTNSYGTFDPDFPLEIGRYVPTTAITNHTTLKGASMLCLHSSNNVNDSKSGLMFSGALHPTDGCSAGIVANHENVAENSEATSLSFYTTASETLGERLRITTTGLIQQYGFTGTADTGADDLALGNTTGGVNRGMTIWSNSTQNGSVAFADNDSNFRGAVQYLHNGDHLRFLTSGTERVRINGGGDVGIGTDDPERLLHLHQHSAASCYLHMTNESTGKATTDGFSLYVATDGQTYYRARESTGTHRFYTAGTERVTITSAGNVDINGTPPWSVSGGDYRNLSISGQTASSSGFLWLGNGAAASNADFDVARIRMCNGGTEVAQIAGSTHTSATDDGRLSFWTKSTSATLAERIRIHGTGQILYSAASGDNTITSKRTNAAGSNGNYFFHVKATNDGNDEVGSFGFHRDTATDDARIVFNTRNTGGSSTERLRISSTGLMTQTGQTRISQSSTHSHGLNAGTVFEVRGDKIGDGATDVDYFKGFKLALNDQTEWGSQAQFSVGRWEENGNNARSSFVLSLGHGQINSGSNADVDVFTCHSNGRMYVGHSGNNAGSNGRFYVTSSGSNECTADLHHSSNDNSNVLNLIHGGAGVNGNPTRVMVEFRNFANNAIATIQSNSTTVTYNTGSDYRMKENQVDISDGITRVKQLKPYRFNWKSEYGGGDKVDGFFAHEAATVVPEAVQGTKDAVDSNGDIIRQQIDPSKLVPLLTAALQEAITKIETLETKVAALESS